MTELEARALIATLEAAHKQFKALVVTVTALGMHVVFADTTMSMATISDWIVDAGYTPLFVGRLYRMDRWVMNVEIRP